MTSSYEVSRGRHDIIPHTKDYAGSGAGIGGEKGNGNFLHRWTLPRSVLSDTLPPSANGPTPALNCRQYRPGSENSGPVHSGDHSDRSDEVVSENSGPVHSEGAAGRSNEVVRWDL